MCCRGWLSEKGLKVAKDDANSFRVAVDIPQEEYSSCEEQDEEVHDFPKECDQPHEPNSTLHDDDSWD